MAITKIYAIRSRLDRRIDYAVNHEKTALDARICYAVNPKKTEQLFFADTINCQNAQTAYGHRRAGPNGGAAMEWQQLCGGVDRYPSCAGKFSIYRF